MKLFYDKNIHITPYPKLGGESEDKRIKNTWMFPDIVKSFPPIYDGNNIVISAAKYYVTSGEALRKTEILISDIKELMDKYPDNEKILASLSDLFLDISEFYLKLIEVKGPSKYLEVTKCEDGIYNGNICARKDPKKKK